MICIVLNKKPIICTVWFFYSDIQSLAGHFSDAVDYVIQRFGKILSNRFWTSKKLLFLFSMKATSAMWLDVPVRFQWKCMIMRLRCLWKLTLLRTTLKFKMDEKTNDLYNRVFLKLLISNHFKLLVRNDVFADHTGEIHKYHS